MRLSLSSHWRIGAPGAKRNTSSEVPGLATTASPGASARHLARRMRASGAAASAAAVQPSPVKRCLAPLDHTPRVTLMMGHDPNHSSTAISTFAPIDAYIDPPQPRARAIITHGHADHARSGHGAVLATPDTIAIMKARYGEDCAGPFEPLDSACRCRSDGVTITLLSGRAHSRLGAGAAGA